MFVVFLICICISSLCIISSSICIFIISVSVRCIFSKQVPESALDTKTYMKSIKKHQTSSSYLMAHVLMWHHQESIRVASTII